MKTVLWLGVVMWVAAPVPSSAQRAATVVDLGHALSEASPSWTGERTFHRTVTATAAKDGYETGSFSSDEHFGTHLDAPIHFGGRWTTDTIPVDRLVRPAVCINVEAAVARDDDYRVTLGDLKAFEARHGTIPEGAVVLIATGWDRRWPDAARYMNVRDGVKHFPGLSVEAGAYLAKERRVAGIGIDTPSVDHGPSAKFETHHATLALNLYHVENAANLTRLPPAGFTVVVAPINIVGGSGGPTRLFALVPAQ